MSEQSEGESFIRIYDNAVSRQFCVGLIEYFEWCLKTNRYWNRPEGENIKKDQSAALNPVNYWDISFTYQNLNGYINEFNTSFWDVCYSQYIKEFDTLTNYSRHTIYTYKLQKTLPGGGYHVWHCENGSVEFSRRIGVYILYLNDVVEGGETEFLYQNLRVPPKEGTLVIFPSAYTHTHRGNPPLRGSKYIMTGWIEYA